MGRDQLVASHVAHRPLDAPVEPADGQTVGRVEVGVRAVVLLRPVFHDSPVNRPVAIDGQPDSPTILAGVTEQPVEAMLPRPRSQRPSRTGPERRLVAGLSAHE